MNFLHQQIHFISSLKKKVIAAFILGVFLSFIILFLEPFDTNQYESNNRLLNLLGFGGLLTLVFLLQSILENKWYYNNSKVWTVTYEIISVFLFFAISGSVIYFYNHFYINGLEYKIASHWWYYRTIVLIMIPVIAPVYIYLRQRFGERIVPLAKSTIIITGANKNEELIIEKDDLYFIKAIENYIEIGYIDADKNLITKTFRQSLSKVQQQIPFIEKCHRSFLVNMNQISAIEGNSQSAKITFKDIDKKIPLSKTLYKTISDKFNLSVRQK
ncbi:LytTR family DNA-binding domain-containing protein [Crocinitomix catalasitica]|uniref:LytTR family DNA-binding domain-containing protein n=1 Tax=Crocinitomix catalasitica TaxID=184607 RepID=UPI000487D039|nr:LytTR family DNA-binding domain-containing protein [Crocinitomix catalasitica]